MGFVEAVKTCFRKYVGFSGRASRPEYWWFFLAVIAGSVVFGIFDSILFGVEPVPVEGDRDPPVAEGGGGPLQGIWGLATLLPLIAVGWRRLHDTGRPGWYILLPALVQIAAAAIFLLGFASFDAPAGEAAPAIGLGVLGILLVAQIALAILLIWWLTRPSEPQTNAFGPPPA